MISLVALSAGGGCATQDNGDLVNDDTAGSSFSGNGTSSGNGGGGNSNGGNGSAGTVAKAGMSNGGNGTAGNGTAGSHDGGSGGMAVGGTGGASAGAGGKGGAGGAGGSAGAGGKGGAGGAGGQPQVDTCKNGKLDNNEADSDCGGVCATKCATGKMCDTQNDCNLSDLCDESKCRAKGCAGTECAYPITKYVIASSAAKGQVIVTWDSDSLDLEITVLDATVQDDSANNWEDDSVEIYLDLDHAKSGTYNLANDFQITVPRAATALSGTTNYTQASVVVDRSSDANGYTLKVSIPWNALNGTASPVGNTIGFDVGINDDTNTGTRDAQVMVYGDLNNYQSTAAFGDLVLTP